MIQFVKDVSRPFRMWLKEFLISFDVVRARRNYARQIVRCRNKLRNGERLNVVFLVSELSKWKTQSLYDLMGNSSEFNVVVAISCRGDWWNHPEYEKLLDECVNDFKSKGMNYVVVADFKTMKDRPLEVLRPDIVFYEQPYDWRRQYMPLSVSRRALTFYVPYFVPTSDDHPKEYALPFHRTLFRHIELNDAWANRFNGLLKNVRRAGDIVGLGHTYYDSYMQYVNMPQGHRDYVIYAPHWTFDHPGNVNSQNIGTFLWNGREILSYALSHPEIKWVFKPHPGLQWRLVDSGAWTEEAVKEYYDAWEKIGVSYFGNDYTDLFMKSRVMITDCGSFLGEYPPCGGALIHLRSSSEKLHPHILNKKLYEQFYQVYDRTELYEVLDEVVLKGHDPKKEARMLAVHELKLVGNHAAENIVNYLREVLK